jgi:hypothetical protein
MFELIYYSSANPNLDENDILDILKKSKEFNSKNQVTGCLLYHNNEFVQLLEGDEETVEILYAKIEQDKRHYDLVVLKRDNITDRSFENWSMAYYQPASGTKDNLGELLFKFNFLALSQLAEKPSEASKLFWYISKLLLEEK